MAELWNQMSPDERFRYLARTVRFSVGDSMRMADLSWEQLSQTEQELVLLSVEV